MERRHYKYGKLLEIIMEFGIIKILSALCILKNRPFKRRIL